jgi:hypothetical protein
MISFASSRVPVGTGVFKRRVARQPPAPPLSQFPILTGGPPPERFPATCQILPCRRGTRPRQVSDGRGGDVRAHAEGREAFKAAEGNDASFRDSEGGEIKGAEGREGGCDAMEGGVGGFDTAGQ